MKTTSTASASSLNSKASVKTSSDDALVAESATPECWNVLLIRDCLWVVLEPVHLYWAYQSLIALSRFARQKTKIAVLVSIGLKVSDSTRYVVNIDSRRGISLTCLALRTFNRLGK